MPDYNSHDTVMTSVEDAQDVDKDNREASREADHFVNKRDGQWEPHIVQNMSGRPRYTFDQVNPIIDQIMFPVSQSDFDIAVEMAGGDSTKETALLYDGIIRNVENISGARAIYDMATREMATTGLAGWRVVSDWVDADAFDQDLLIKTLSNFVDRVWFDPNAVLQTMEDAEWCTILTPLYKPVYEKKYPKGSGMSIGDGRSSEVYYDKKESVVVGELLYKERTKRILVEMSNNAIYEDNADFRKVEDELAQSGITEVRRRDRDAVTVHSRKYDGGDWLEEAKKTVFQYLPVIPCFGNFKISEGKVIYWGAVEKLMDPQRVLNYAESRDIEEGALAPRGKYWMTRKQAEADKETLQTMNTNADPVQLYTHVDGQPPPSWVDPPQTNPGLQITSDKASRQIQVAAGKFAANMGDNPGLQSGIAIERQQDRGDNGSFKYLESRNIAQEHTSKVMIRGAIPQVYDTRRQVRTIKRDGNIDMVTINDEVFDQQTGQFVTLNDTSKGIYDVTSTVGPSYRNRQEETVEKITAVSAIDPSVIQLGGDVLLNNIQSPGFDQIAERKRALMVQQGAIPEDQMTDDEKQLVAAQQQQGQQPSAVDQALAAQAQAETEKAQANTADIISKAQERSAKIEIEQQKLALSVQQTQLKAQQEQQQFKLDLQAQIISGHQAVSDQIKTQAETLKAIKDAMGVDQIVGPGNTEAYIKQAEILTDTQNEAQ